MRSSVITFALLLPLGLAAGCATSNAGKTCEPVASWSAPAYRCVGPAVEAKVEPEAEQPPPPPPPAPPKAEIKGKKIELNENVEFKTGSHELANATDPVLEEVVQILKTHPEVIRIRIEGHTDTVGTAKYNQKLSDRRANTVREYLISHGVETSRLTSKGFGMTRPIATNKTGDGRAQNRRVEIRIQELKEP
jgi:OmpA-OmpF porin, OOP family